MTTRRVTVVSAHQGADRQMDLTEAQLDGLACVQCGERFQGSPPLYTVTAGYVDGKRVALHTYCREDYRHPREAT